MAWCTARLHVAAVGFIAWILGNLFFVRDNQRIKKADSAALNSVVCLVATVCLLSTWPGRGQYQISRAKSDATR